MPNETMLHQFYAEMLPSSLHPIWTLVSDLIKDGGNMFYDQTSLHFGIVEFPMLKIK